MKVYEKAFVGCAYPIVEVVVAFSKDRENLPLIEFTCSFEADWGLFLQRLRPLPLSFSNFRITDFGKLKRNGEILPEVNRPLFSDLIADAIGGENPEAEVEAVEEAGCRIPLPIDGHTGAKEKHGLS